MRVPEAVINQQLCYMTEGGLWVPYDSKALTDMCERTL